MHAEVYRVGLHFGLQGSHLSHQHQLVSTDSFDQLGWTGKDLLDMVVGELEAYFGHIVASQKSPWYFPVVAFLVDYSLKYYTPYCRTDCNLTVVV